MDFHKNIKLATILTTLSAFILFCAIVTIKATFSYQEDIEETVSWDVFFTEANIFSDNGNVIVSPEHIDFNFTLNEENKEFSFLTTIINDSSFDAKIINVNKSDLDNIIVLENNKKLSDIIDYHVYYKNGVELSNNDTLKPGEEKEVYVSVKLKDDNENIELDNIDLFLDVDFLQN